MFMDTHSPCSEKVAPPFPGKTALVKSEDIKKSIKKACSDSCCLMQRVSLFF